MATREVLARELSSGDDLAMLLDDLQSRAGETIEITVPEDSEVLRTADEFQSLAGAARNAGVQLRLDTPDPIRQQFSRIFGLSVDLRESIARQTTRVSSKRAGTSTREAADAPTEPSLAASRHERKSSDLSTFRDELFEDDASFSFVITPPKPRLSSGEMVLPAHSAAQHRSRSSSRARLLFGFTAIGVVVGVIILMIGILAPWMSVTVVPSTGTASHEITYGLAGSGVPLDMTIEPREISARSTFEGSIETTGSRTVPDGVATGTITITNASTSEQYLEAGTQLLTAVESVTVTLDEDVYIPPADPFGAMTFGSATASITADIAGPEGNLVEGEIAGQISETLFYSNRTALSGGSTRTISVVSEDDLASLRAQAEDALITEIDSAIDREVAPGERLIDSSIQQSDIAYEYSHDAGADAERVSVVASINATAKVYEPDQLQEAGERAVVEGLPGQVPENHALNLEEVEIGDPERINEGPLPAYRISVQGPTTAIVDPAELDRLEAELIGADAEVARQLLRQIEGVERYEIERGPDWLPATLPPRLSSRIAVQVEETIPPASEQAGSTR